MMLNKPKKRSLLLGAAMLVATLAASGVAAEEPRLQVDVRVYQVLTNITGAGLTSRTLPGPQGWFQIVHQRLDEVELAMEGENLTWNGQAEPDYERIIPLARPVLAVEANENAVVNIDSPGIFYMERKDSGLYEMKPAPEKVGLTFSLAPRKVDAAAGIYEGSLQFAYAWVKDRERMEGMPMDVGKPIIGQVEARGGVQLRFGEWSCFQTPVESEGWMFVFVRVSPDGGAAAPAAPSAEIKDVAEKPDAAGAIEKKGPKLEVGGSIEVRGNMYTGH